MSENKKDMTRDFETGEMTYVKEIGNIKDFSTGKILSTVKQNNTFRNKKIAIIEEENEISYSDYNGEVKVPFPEILVKGEAQVLPMPDLSDVEVIDTRSPKLETGRLSNGTKGVVEIFQSMMGNSNHPRDPLEITKKILNGETAHTSNSLDIAEELKNRIKEDKTFPSKSEIVESLNSNCVNKIEVVDLDRKNKLLSSFLIVLLRVLLENRFDYTKAKESDNKTLGELINKLSKETINSIKLLINKTDHLIGLESIIKFLEVEQKEFMLSQLIRIIRNK